MIGATAGLSLIFRSREVRAGAAPDLCKGHHDEACRPEVGLIQKALGPRKSRRGNRARESGSGSSGNARMSASSRCDSSRAPGCMLPVEHPGSASASARHCRPTEEPPGSPDASMAVRLAPPLDRVEIGAVKVPNGWSVSSPAATSSGSHDRAERRHDRR